LLWLGVSPQELYVILAIGIKFFGRTGNITAFAALGVRVLGTAFEERGIALGEFLI
jgi:hypothetical protein